MVLLTFLSFSLVFVPRIILSQKDIPLWLYSIHINAFYDINKRILHLRHSVSRTQKRQPCFLPACRQMISLTRIKELFLSGMRVLLYNNMAHVIEKNSICFSYKDITSKGLIGNFVFPDSDTFDITVDELLRDPIVTIKIQRWFLPKIC